MGTGEFIEDLPNPELAELQQRQVLAPVLLVKPDGPVTGHELPCRRGAAGTEVLASTTMVKILGGPDDKRKRVVISADGDILVSLTGNTGSGMRLHGVAGPLEVTCVQPIWISLPSGSTPVNVGWLAEYWAD